MTLPPREGVRGGGPTAGYARCCPPKEGDWRDRLYASGAAPGGARGTALALLLAIVSRRATLRSVEVANSPTRAVSATTWSIRMH